MTYNVPRATKAFLKQFGAATPTARALVARLPKPVQGFLASIALNSLEPMLRAMQKLADTFRCSSLQNDVEIIRAVWRVRFEELLNSIAETRGRETVDVLVRFYGQNGCQLPPQPHELLYAQAVEDLVNDAVFLAQADDLHTLPMGVDSLRRRVLATDRAFEIHAAARAHELLAGKSLGEEE